MTSNDVLAAYCSDVPVIGCQVGGPPYVTLRVVPWRLIAAVCGTSAASSAVCACGVPGTLASTQPRGPLAGIFAKSAGKVWLANDHGPDKLAAANQRPDVR